MAAASASCVYFGQVRHRRFAPTEHAFHYRLFLMYLNLADLPAIFDRFWLWSARRPAPAWFRRADYHRGTSPNLEESVRATVEEMLGFRPQGPICLLTHLRYWGYVFNPVSLYYCFAPDGETLEAILAEVTNTPWGERHDYCLNCREQGSREGSFHRFEFPKRFHVSPFMPMNVVYRWSLSLPGERLSAHISDTIEGTKVFDATLALDRRPMTGATMARALAAHPLMTLKVVAAIHWQAFRLFLKKTPFHTHPKHRAAQDSP